MFVAALLLATPDPVALALLPDRETSAILCELAGRHFDRCRREYELLPNYSTRLARDRAERRLWLWMAASECRVPREDGSGVDFDLRAFAVWCSELRYANGLDP